MLKTPPAHPAVLVLSAAFFLTVWIPSFLAPFGYFIDEFYYLACAERPDFGYVDHPPFSIMILALSRAILGESLPALRFVPALVGALTVLLTALLARRLGAGLFGQLLAGLCLATAPIPLVLFGVYSMNSLGIFLWTLAFYILVVLLETDQPRLWLAFGAVAGIGLINKHTFVLIAIGLAVGLLLTPARRHLANRWLWLGAAVAAMLLLPNIVWQLTHGWPSLEFYRNADLYKNVQTPPLEIFIQQVIFQNPGTFLIWFGGLVFLLRGREAQSWRTIGWACLTLLVLMIVSQKSRPDRIAGIYPMLFAAGATWLDRFIAVRSWTALRPVAVLLVLVPGIAMSPIAVPYQSPEKIADFAARTGAVPQIERGEGKASQLPQWLADRLGWPEFVADIEAAIDEHIAPEERDRAAIVVPSYGHAGALELLGRDDLPPILSPQNTYHLWSQDVLDAHPFDVGLTVLSDPDELRQLFEHVEVIGTHRCTGCMPWRNNMPIYLVRGPKVPLADVWEQFKNYT